MCTSLLLGRLSVSTCVSGDDDSLNPYNGVHTPYLEHKFLIQQFSSHQIIFLHAYRLFDYLTMSKHAKLPDLSN